MNWKYFTVVLALSGLHTISGVAPLANQGQNLVKVAGMGAKAIGNQVKKYIFGSGNIQNASEQIDLDPLNTAVILDGPPEIDNVSENDTEDWDAKEENTFQRANQFSSWQNPELLVEYRS